MAAPGQLAEVPESFPDGGTAVTATVLDDIAEVEWIAPEWDALAVQLERPYCAPGWLLAWWRHVAPAGARLSVVVVRDEGDVVAVAPFYTYRWRGLRVRALLATDISSRVEPLVRPGYDLPAAQAIAAALAGDRRSFDVLALFGLPESSDWAGRLRTAWPGRKPLLHRRPGQLAPTVSLGFPDLDAWFSSRSSNFRHQMRRFRRRLTEAGATFRVTASVAELEHDVREFERLHRGRWDHRGGTTAFPGGTTEMLVEAGRELLPSGRFRLALIEIDGQAIAAQLYLAAGGELTVWNTGFDDAYAELRPSYVCLVDGVGAGLAGGYSRFDLGAGSQRYKYRFADGEDRLEWVALTHPSPRRVFTLAVLAPQLVRYAITMRLDAETKDKIRRLIARLPTRRAKAREPSRSQ
jgi:CelD/BcsL family acetyltransferase involved in cellulose biosynthesis